MPSSRPGRTSAPSTPASTSRASTSRTIDAIARISTRTPRPGSIEPDVEDPRRARPRQIVPVEPVHIDAGRRQDHPLGPAPPLERLDRRRGRRQHEIGREQAGLLVAAVLRVEVGIERGLPERGPGQVIDHGVAEPGPRLEHRDPAPAIATVHDVVVGPVELPLERALKRLDLRPQIGLVGRHPQHADRPLPLDVGLLALAHHQQIDGVHRRQRPDHVPELDPGPARPWHRGEPGQQHAGHGSNRRANGRTVQARTPSASIRRTTRLSSA